MKTAQTGNTIKSQLKKVIVGQDTVINEIMSAFFAGGHVLLEGVPGLGKTLLAKSMAKCLKADFSRIQFTPDLMPSDIIGVNMYYANEGVFKFKSGPVFTNILLADEINRTPPKTQSALLQAMEERFITVDSENYRLPEPFFVIATQNPIEYEGTYPLPETQLDRFLMKILIDYPAMKDEEDILRMTQSGMSIHSLIETLLESVADTGDILECQRELAAMKVEDALLGYITQITNMTRKASQVLLGASPRASIALMQCAKTYAALEGRDYVIPDDIKTMAKPVLRHRIILRPEAELENITTDNLIESLMTQISVPR